MNPLRCIFIVAAVIAVVCSGKQSMGLAQTRTSHLTVAVAGHSNSTPSLAVDGRTVALVWTATKDGVANLYLAISSDGGTTFSPPRRVNDLDGDAGATNEQPPRVVISGSGSRRVITVMWAKRDPGALETRRDIIRIARSTDGGSTFSPARYTHDPSLSGARGWQSVALAADSSVHALWLDGRDARRQIEESAKHTGVPHKGQPPQDLYHATLAPDGRTVESMVARGVCFCCKTAVAVDARGTVYAAWRHIFPGSMRDIAFAMSTDGGRRFSPLVKVSEDNWQLNGCPEDGPAMGVDSAGLIHIAWGTVVNDAEPYKALFYTKSRDGKTFAPRMSIQSGRENTPGHPQMVLTREGVAVAFDEVLKGVRRVSLARVSAAGVLRPLLVSSGDESASHPAVAHMANGHLVVAWTSRPSPGRTGDLAEIRVARLVSGR
jgi:hypothetical protein